MDRAFYGQNKDMGGGQDPQWLDLLTSTKYPFTTTGPSLTTENRFGAFQIINIPANLRITGAELILAGSDIGGGFVRVNGTTYSINETAEILMSSQTETEEVDIVNTNGSLNYLVIEMRLLTTGGTVVRSSQAEFYFH